ncbi:MAG: T9SS type A sorting domain-containing protein [Bacteroidota bacterium]|nr:T9SS type A sorting domain-containing protein [Bacteroidota bacterium]MDP3146238.1 T9SS type A sorting domain-containing protein [Bacteroidota bacterium]MDP3558135.1 T9SS type A sorting domain-containing protein [Bacteroidota bacterium]
MRKFRLYVPNIYTGSQAVPLILNLHGYTSNASQQQLYSNFMPIADTANFLVVHPDGKAPNGSPYWNAGFGGTENDVLFMSDLIDSLKLNYNIDLNSVYSCGMSNGGIMSYYLACNLPNKIAAIASVTGSMLNSWFTCAPTRPFPIMEIHGTNDATVPYNGSGTFAHIDSVVKKWRMHSNCNAAPITYSVPNINTSDNSYAVNYKYTNGTNGSTVELYKVFGGSHSWPGAFPFIANTNQDFNASVEIWRFFRQYKLNQFISGVGLNEMSFKNNIKIFPNPVTETLYLEGISDCKLKVVNLIGETIINETSANSINVSELNSGIYFLQITSASNKSVIKFIKN